MTIKDFIKEHIHHIISDGITPGQVNETVQAINLGYDVRIGFYDTDDDDEYVYKACY